MVQLSGRSIQISANGLNHHLLSYGDPARRPMFFLPGITSPAATADFIASRAADLGFSVWTPDIRGRGLTDAPGPGSYTLSHYAADVDALISALGIATPIVIGHSMGARIAAAWLRNHPPAEQSLVVMVDPPLSGPRRPPYPTKLESFLTQLAQARDGATFEQVRRDYPGFPDREVAIRVEWLKSCDETAIRETHRGFHEENFFDYWPFVLPPAALIFGEESAVVQPDDVAKLAQANPLIPVLGVPSAGHMVPWDNPNGFWDILEPLLRNTVER